MKKYIKASVHKMIQKDDYENGCNFDCTDFGMIEQFTFDTIDEAIKKLESYYGKMELIDDHLVYSRLENSMGYEASNTEMEAWKLGQKDLWLADYTFFLQEITQSDIMEESLTPFFVNVRQ